MGNTDKDNLAEFLFLQGTNYRTYEYLGAHREKGGYAFRVWAPNADLVYLVGDFNGWDESCPMQNKSGIWEYTLDVSRFGNGAKYKFKIIRNGRCIYKADPYAAFSEKAPATASVYFDIGGYRWGDEKWMKKRMREHESFYSRPINIYEVHALSWKRNSDGTPYSWRQLSKTLIPYVKEMGYTHIELMPIAEHPYEGSWGYQICGYYAPTSRLGTPHDFMAFIDAAHKADIGVILDWVPAHFPKDEHGLYEFDGSPLYEFQGADRMEHKSWGTRCFDVGRNEVQCFLVSNAVYFAKEYHIDGLRVDAVASMLYLDYDRAPWEWVKNVYGTNRSLEAIAFFKKLNTHMRESFPDVLMIAEESTAWENITSLEGDGLGFSLKWNMGWMNDSLSYISIDPYFRSGCHDKVTFPMVYAHSEKYVLPISHDEVVHGKRSLLDRFAGLYGQKFDGLRAFLIYMMCHPGKKLMFMGCEIGQFDEWSYEREVEWFLTDYESHKKLQSFVRDLNLLYLSSPALFEEDGSWQGFEWVEVDNREESIIAFRRMAKNGDSLLAVINFTPVERPRHLLEVNKKASYTVLIDSMSKSYGGYKKSACRKASVKKKGGGYTLSIDIPAHGAVILKEKTN